MIIYKCKCGDEFIAHDNTEEERGDKVIWKKEHGTRRGCYKNLVTIHNPGHGYIRNIARKEV